MKKYILPIMVTLLFTVQLSAETGQKTIGSAIPRRGSLTVSDVGYDVDALLSYGGGANYNSTTINAAIKAIGSTNRVALVLRPGSWVMNANITVPSNITLKIVPGAFITTTGYTLAINGPFEAGLYQVFVGKWFPRIRRRVR